MAADNTHVTNLLSMAPYEMDSMLCNHHLDWLAGSSPVLGRSLPANPQDEFAVAVIRNSQIVGHVLSGIIFTCHVVFYQTKRLCHLSYYWEKEERKRLRSTI